MLLEPANCSLNIAPINPRLNGDLLDADRHGILAAVACRGDGDQHPEVTAGQGQSSRPYRDSSPAPVTVEVTSLHSSSPDDVCGSATAAVATLPASIVCQIRV